MLYVFFWVVQMLGHYPEESTQQVIKFIVMLVHAWSQINMKDKQDIWKHKYKHNYQPTIRRQVSHHTHRQPNDTGLAQK
jgi:hypothetical protein